VPTVGSRTEPHPPPTTLEAALDQNLPSSLLKNIDLLQSYFKIIRYIILNTL
jgi:hypothetical protein